MYINEHFFPLGYTLLHLCGGCSSCRYAESWSYLLANAALGCFLVRKKIKKESPCLVGEGSLAHRSSTAGGWERLHLQDRAAGSVHGCRPSGTRLTESTAAVKLGRSPRPCLLAASAPSVNPLFLPRKRFSRLFWHMHCHASSSKFCLPGRQGCAFCFLWHSRGWRKTLTMHAQCNLEPSFAI